MTLLKDIDFANNQAIQQQKLAPDAPWTDIWSMAKQFPFKGILEIEMLEDLLFSVVNLNDDALAIRYFWTDGAVTEPDSFAIWSKLSPYSRFTIDAGAYTGFYAILAGLQCTAPVVAYEPVSFIYARLASNVILNQLPHITCRNIALSDRDGIDEMSLRFGPVLFSSGSSLLSVRQDTNPTSREPCYVSSLDALHAQDPVDLIKIDVEGAEHKLLQGTATILKVHKPVLILETRKDTHGDVIQYLGSLDYSLQHIEDESGAQNFICWHSESKLSKVVQSEIKKR